MRKFLKFFLFLASGLIIFFIVIHKAGWHNIEQALSLFFSPAGLVVIFFALLFAFLGVWKWQIILKEQGHSFSLKALSPLWLLEFALSYLTPFAFFGGEIFCIYFTKKRFPHLKWEKPMASVACAKLLDATAFFFFLILGMVAFTFFGRFPHSFAIGASVLVAGALFSLLALFYFKRYKKESVLEWLIDFVGIKKERIANGNAGGEAIFQAEKEVFQFFDLKKKAFWQALSLAFLRYLICVFKAGVLFFFLVGNVSVLKSLAIYGFVALSALTPMPATLGALELGEGIAFKVLGFSFSTGTVFSMVWRGADVLLCLAGVLFLLIYTVKLTEEKVLKFFGRS